MAAPSSCPPFSPALFTFFDELTLHNDREWFAANKVRYERDVRDPFLAFIAALAPRFATVAPAFRCDPRPVGGSYFRIYRDTRFGKDKTPYKTHAAAQFRHGAGKDVHGPGYYLHLSPTECLSGFGLWRPEPDIARKVRTAMVGDTAGWIRAKAGIPLGGESAKRVPAGFPADHPAAEDLKRKDFISMRPYAREEVLSPDFLDRYVADCAAASPFMSFLTRAVGLPW